MASFGWVPVSSIRLFEVVMWGIGNWMSDKAEHFGMSIGVESAISRDEYADEGGFD